MEIFVLLLIGWILKKVFSQQGNQKTNRRAARRKQPGMDAFYREGFGSQEGSPSGRSTVFSRPIANSAPVVPNRPEPARPSVHTHVEPACDEHDRAGSLKFSSTEGVDDCHEGQMTSMRQNRSALAETEEKPGLELDWNGENMVKAFVMQEILTRPCDRRRRA